MNLSIYLKLRIANALGKVRIRETYKHLEYMNENNYISPITEGWVEIAGFPIPSHNHWYTITTEGKKAMWTKGSLLFTRAISVGALIISLLSLGINYFTKIP